MAPMAETQFPFAFLGEFPFAVSCLRPGGGPLAGLSFRLRAPVSVCVSGAVSVCVPYRPAPPGEVKINGGLGCEGGLAG